MDRGAAQEIRSSSVRDAAYENFRGALIKGHIRAGQVVTQRDLVALMSLSIGTLREVLPRLEAEGLLTVLPQRGIQITAIDLAMIRDTFQMRAALEREAVLQAVRHMPDDLLTEQRRMHAHAVEKVQQQPTPELLSEGQAIDNGFHHLLIDATRNALLIRAYEITTIRMRLINLDRIRLTAAILPEAFSDHLAVIDALLERDAAAATSAMDHHIRNARDRATAL